MHEAPLLRLFGAPALELPGGAVRPFLPQRPYQALAYLACRADWVARTELAGWLWSAHDAEDARRNLRKVLVQAREIAGGSLEARGDLLRWDIDSDLGRIVAADASGRHDEALAALGKPLMQGLELGLSNVALEWLQTERLRLQQRLRATTLARVRELGERPSERVLLCERLLALDVLDDDATVELARARAALGQRAAALRALEDHERALADRLGIEPSPAVRAARLALLPPPDAEAAPAVPDGPPPVAPAPNASGCVGRRVEMLQLADLIGRPACRVLTIIGPGGIGKTRLARLAAGELAPRFAAGVHWVDGAGLADAAQLGQRLASALDIELRGGAALWPQIVGAVSDRSLLCVIDNTEQIEGAAPALAGLLAACTRLKLLVTSRERLAIDGEWLLPLAGLPLPDADEDDAEVLASFDAVRLFDLRARSVLPAFELAAQAAAVVRLLHAVQGMPLAIELAAPWVRLLPVREIADEITRSSELLAQGSGSRQGLQACFARSWDRLDDGERAVLGRLAALPDACDLAMAREVAATDLPMLAALADKSLLQAQDDGRFGLHPLVRQCTLERAGELSPVQARHAEYVALWLERLGSGNGVARWTELERGLVHARAAWAWALRHRAGGLVARSARTLMRFYEALGLWDEGLAMLGAAVQRFEDGSADGAAALCTTLRCLATLQYRHGEFEACERNARRGLRLARQLGDLQALKAGLNNIGLSLWVRGRFVEAQPYFRDALRRAEADKDSLGMAVFLGNLAMVETASGDYEAALTHQLACVQRKRSTRPEGLGDTLNNAANAHRALGRFDAAQALLDEALALSERLDLRALRPYLLVNLGVLDLDRGRREAARRWLVKAEVAALERGGEIAVEALLWRAVLDADEGDPAAAAARLRESLRRVRELRSNAFDARWLAVFARWSAQRGALADAAQAWQAVLARPGLSALDRDDALRRLAPPLLQAMTAAAGLPCEPAGASRPDGAGFSAALTWAGERLEAFGLGA